MAKPFISAEWKPSLGNNTTADAMASFSLQAPSLSVLLLVGQMDSPPLFPTSDGENRKIMVDP
jgi:hypothetical protein